MSTALATSPWYRRWGAAVARALTITSKPAEATMGADFASGTTASPSYDVGTAMSAYAAFPWVVACLDAISTDLSGLPIRLRRGKGAKAEVVEDHPFLDLLDRPHSQMDGLTFRRQWPIDHLLAGDWYAVILWGGRAPAGLQRLHPEQVRIEPDPIDAVRSYVHEHVSGRTAYAPDDILRCRRSSWESGPEGLYGQGLIRALQLDLNTDLQSARRAQQMSKVGRPDAIISPASEGDSWAEPVRKEIKAAYNRLLAEGGALVLGGGAKVEIPSWSPRDMEFEKIRLGARDAVLAAFGVPPTRVGLPTANYATAREQSMVYWQNLMGLASLFDAQITRLARLFDRDLTAYHDFSRVDALQASRTERLDRVHGWKLLGATAADAAAYEGFDDAPVSDDAEESATPKPAEDAPSKATRAAVAQVFGFAGSAALRVVPAADPRDAPDVTHAEPEPVAVVWDAPLPSQRTTEDARAALARAFVTQLHEPAEARYAVATTRLLRQQRQRVIAKLEAVSERATPNATGPEWLESIIQSTGVAIPVTRDLLLDAILALLWDAMAEDAALSTALDGPLRQALAAAFRVAMTQMGHQAALDASEIANLTDEILKATRTQVNATTRGAIASILEEGLRTGSTTAEIADRIARDTRFGYTRALTVARTEATKSLNAGTEAAFRVAERDGVQVRKEWLSARDSHVRLAHVLLDGQTAGVGEVFTVPSGEYAGATAHYPGDFDSAALVANCRCALIPVLPE